MSGLRFSRGEYDGVELKTQPQFILYDFILNPSPAEPGYVLPLQTV